MRIEPEVKVRALLLALGLSACLPVFGGTPGTFRGVLVRRPDAGQGWTYVAGRNGSLRRVEISQASVRYSSSVPMKHRRASPVASLKAGAEVRISAEIDQNSDWHAREIEILKLADGR